MAPPQLLMALLSAMLVLVLSPAVSANTTEPVSCGDGGTVCPEHQTCGGQCGPGVCCDLKELHCSKGGSWCPPGETCGGPVCGPGPRCCDETVDGMVQRPISLDPSPPPSEPTTDSPAEITEAEVSTESTSAQPTEDVSRRPPRRRRPEFTAGRSSLSADSPTLRSSRRRPENTSGRSTVPSEGVPFRSTRRRRPEFATGRPSNSSGDVSSRSHPRRRPQSSAGPSGSPPSETDSAVPRGRRRCRPGTKCVDNFPCEQGGSVCPPGHTCGGECGTNTCCARNSSQCGEGGDQCPAGFTCRSCPLPGGACCMSTCDHPGAYVAEPCGMDEICLPCKSGGEQLCCQPQPKTLEACHRQCRRERGKECFLFGCPQGEGWCCRQPTPAA